MTYIYGPKLCMASPAKNVHNTKKYSQILGGGTVTANLKVSHPVVLGQQYKAYSVYTSFVRKVLRLI
jgi:hypothetical protein